MAALNSSAPCSGGLFNRRQDRLYLGVDGFQYGGQPARKRAISLRGYVLVEEYVNVQIDNLYYSFEITNPSYIQENMRNSLKKPLATTLLSIAALGVIPAVSAEVLDFTVVYRPIQDAPYTTTETAVLKLTLDTKYIVTAPNTGANINVLPYITNFSLTVSGANYGNGTYGISDYAALLFDTSGTLDYTRELLGQNNYGPSSKAEFGTLDIIANNNSSPTEVTPMTILTAGIPQNDKFNEHMVVSSITAVRAVPEPSTYAMLIGGLGLIGFIARRRKNNG